MPISKICQYCKKIYFVTPYKKEISKYCSRECMSKAKKGTKKGEWIEKICPSCGKSFETLKSQNKKYCSLQCNEDRFDTKPPIVNCENCGKEFRPHPSSWTRYQKGEQKTLLCSKECVNESKKKGILIQCANCGKEIYRTPYRLSKNKNQYCSNKCEKEFQHKETFETRICEICGKPFECSKLSTQLLCSVECQKLWQETRVGELNPRYKRNKIKCDWCGSDVFVPDSKLKLNKYFFCGNECRREWYSNVYSQTEEWRDMSRKRAVKILEDGLIPFTNTKPQLIVNSFLDELNINYIAEKGFDYYCVDNYLSDNNLIIEVNGDYWHSNPFIFSQEKLNDIQKTRIRTDKAKHTYILNHYNIEILYLWEYDILNNPDLCKMLILKYIDHAGILDDYNSFNYDIVNNELSLKDYIVFPYQNRKTA